MWSKLFYEAVVERIDFPDFLIWNTEISGYHLTQEQDRKHGNEKVLQTPPVEMHKIHPRKCLRPKPNDCVVLKLSRYLMMSLAKLQGYSSHCGLSDSIIFF